MKRIPFTYRTVKYTHDQAVGESLNIGIILSAPEVSFVGGMFDAHYERLSCAFADFDGDAYRKLVRQLESAIDELNGRTKSSDFDLREPIKSAEMLSKILVADPGLTIEFGPEMGGVTPDIEEEVKYIFHRMVISQYDRKKPEKRTDEEVWRVYNSAFRRYKVSKYLKPKHIKSKDYDLKYEHAFKNEKWHLLEPATMDYAKPQSIQNRATRILGTSTVISGHPDVSKLYILLGKPQSGKYKDAYVKAKNLINKSPMPHEIIEENEAEDFAKHIASYMKEHGVITSD